MYRLATSNKRHNRRTLCWFCIVFVSAFGLFWQFYSSFYQRNAFQVQNQKKNGANLPPDFIKIPKPYDMIPRVKPPLVNMVAEPNKFPLSMTRNFAMRKLNISEACFKQFGFRPLSFRSMNAYRHNKFYSSIVVDDTRNVIFCSIPNVLPMAINENLKTQQASTMNRYTDEKIQSRLMRYKKVMFVR